MGVGALKSKLSALSDTRPTTVHLSKLLKWASPGGAGQ